MVVPDEVGRLLAGRTFATTTAGHLAAVQWLVQRKQVRFAVEDCRHLTRRLANDLLRVKPRVS